MKKKEKKELENKLIDAVKKELTTNNASLTAKFAKSIKHSLKQVERKTKKILVHKKTAVVAN